MPIHLSTNTYDFLPVISENLKELSEKKCKIGFNPYFKNNPSDNIIYFIEKIFQFNMCVLLSFRPDCVCCINMDKFLSSVKFLAPVYDRPDLIFFDRSTNIFLTEPL